MTFIKYLKEVPGVKHILGVDIENVSLHCSPDVICDGEYAPMRETPLQITVCIIDYITYVNGKLFRCLFFYHLQYISNKSICCY